MLKELSIKQQQERVEDDSIKKKISIKIDDIIRDLSGYGNANRKTINILENLKLTL